MSDETPDSFEFSMVPAQKTEQRNSPWLVVGIVGVVGVLCLGILVSVAVAIAFLSNAEETETGSGTATLTVENTTGEDICLLFVSASSNTEWGDDVLGANTILRAGDSFVVENLAQGEYDFLASGCDSDVSVADYSSPLPADEYNVNISGTYTWAIAGTRAGVSGGAGVTFSVLNDSTATACLIYLSPSTADEWGEDLLGPLENAVVTPNERFDMINVPPGSYDLLIEDCDGTVLVEEFGIDVIEDYTWNLRPVGTET